ncbi:MAG: hypothetical protein ACYC3W_12180 [Candidatus Nanopelagicales bacterium]
MSEPMKKFTSAQKAVLTLLCDQAVADYYMVMRIGGNAGTMKKLVEAELVVLGDTPKSYKEWKITQAGRFAKENEFCQEKMLQSAYARLIREINFGTEFPDAVYHVASTCRVAQAKLEKLYDKDVRASNRANQ